MDSDNESEISINSSSTAEDKDDVQSLQWPTKASVDQIALDPKNQSEFEKFVKKKHEQIKRDQETQPGVIYLGHVPYGFAEEPLRKFFSQFGKITRLKLSRSKKTGQSKGYGFIEFEHGEVAKIAADSMNNYLMYEKLFKCKYIPPEKVHKDTFKHCHRRFRLPRNNARARYEHNRNITDEQHSKRMARLEKKLKKKQGRLAKMGLSYDMPISLQPPPPS
ncbi:MKI67 FHA domain-interacting nucleolar phosphoprotein-like [Paramacrobiotus metropolitanus]|uniref:MKI67 FHA domain-interacting nucleolar phosphoprotein-like n=1 Tax=Paramacrobiotus metropolitanus TaxID=2943436 RepID=UPI002446438C|nr:MKI67 FHA domain-interacting nucleolar phosphoprotein-like [Paramacrobiotus metropolitanus]